MYGLEADPKNAVDSLLAGRCADGSGRDESCSDETRRRGKRKGGGVEQDDELLRGGVGVRRWRRNKYSGKTGVLVGLVNKVESFTRKRSRGICFDRSWKLPSHCASTCQIRLIIKNGPCSDLGRVSSPTDLMKAYGNAEHWEIAFRRHRLDEISNIGKPVPQGALKLTCNVHSILAFRDLPFWDTFRADPPPSPFPECGL